MSCERASAPEVMSVRKYKAQKQITKHMAHIIINN